MEFSGRDLNPRYDSSYGGFQAAVESVMKYTGLATLTRCGLIFEGAGTGMKGDNFGRRTKVSPGFSPKGYPQANRILFGALLICFY